MEFEWDEEKAARNEVKQAFTFQTAAPFFASVAKPMDCRYRFPNQKIWGVRS